MKNLIKLIIATAILCSVNACVSTKPDMQYSTVSSAVRNSADKALIVFVRPQVIGASASAGLYDGDQFIGILPYDQKFSYLADPGEHLFMVVSEAADFMPAKLEAGKTYYVEVIPRMGVWDARFSMRPISPSIIRTPKQREWLGRGSYVGNVPEAYRWAKENHKSNMQMKQDYFIKWNKKSEFNKPVLDDKYALQEEIK